MPEQLILFYLLYTASDLKNTKIMSFELEWHISLHFLSSVLFEIWPPMPFWGHMRTDIEVPFWNHDVCVSFGFNIDGKNLRW